MKTKKEVEKELESHKVFYLGGVGIGSDIECYIKYAVMKNYMLSPVDLLVIGCMVGQSKLTTLFNERELKKAIQLYDKTDVMNRFDTAGETFIDLLDLKDK